MLPGLRDMYVEVESLLGGGGAWGFPPPRTGFGPTLLCREKIFLFVANYLRFVTLGEFELLD